MIRRIRAIAASSPGELVGEIFSGLIGPEGAVNDELAEADPSLDLLVKNAMRDASSAEPDAPRIWQQLRNKVKGPFGRIAVEGPAMSTLDSAMMKSGGVVQPAPFAVLDQAGAKPMMGKHGAEVVQDRISPEMFRAAEAQLLR